MTSYMNIMKNIEDQNEQAGKEAYGNVDMVNQPPHYNQAGIECIEAITSSDRYRATSSTYKETSSSTCGDTSTKTVLKTSKKRDGISTS